MHFSQIRSALTSSREVGSDAEPDLLRIELAGFIDVGDLGERLDSLLTATNRAPGAILCDLRGAAGYGGVGSSRAHEWLALASRAGVSRVGLVARSAVVHTATRVIAGAAPIELRSFSSEASARRWLEASETGPQLQLESPSCAAH